MKLVPVLSALFCYMALQCCGMTVVQYKNSQRLNGDRQVSNANIVSGIKIYLLMLRYLF